MSLLDTRQRLKGFQDKIKTKGLQVISNTQKWSQSTETVRDCDVVITFSQSASYESVCWYINLLRSRVPQVIPRCNYHHHSRQYAVYLTCKLSDLLVGADHLALRKRLIGEFGGGLREFSMEEIDLFENYDSPNFFNSKERASIVYHYLNNLQAIKGGESFEKYKFVEGQNISHVLQSAGMISEIFPLHERKVLNKLVKEWFGSIKFTHSFDSLEDYFGVRVALYFAWLGHYTFALIIPSIISLLSWLHFSRRDNYSAYYLVTAVMNILWSMLYLEHWKRTSTYYAFKWGTLDKKPKLLEKARPLFHGELSKCPITGNIVKTYPKWKRKLIVFLISGPVTLISVIFAIYVAFWMMSLQQMTDNFLERIGWQTPEKTSWISYSPKVIHAIVIMLLDTAYKLIATKLTDLENHRLEDTHKNFLVAKLILFQFMNSFYFLFYVAFVEKDMDSLRQLLSTFLIVRQFTGNCKEIFIPMGQTRLRQFYLSLKYEVLKPKEEELHHQSGDTEKDHLMDDSDVHNRVPRVSVDCDGSKQSAKISQAEQESILPNYDDSADDYLEMFIQFGYVSMFACAFPLAGLLAFLNNLLEIRSDAFKLITSFKRPLAKPAHSIGVWQIALDVVSYIAVITNIGILEVSGTLDDYLPKLNGVDRVLLLVAIEHCIFAIRFFISKLIPYTPSFIEHEVAHLEQKRREALKMLERENMREQQRLRSRSSSTASRPPPTSDENA